MDCWNAIKLTPLVSQSIGKCLVPVSLLDVALLVDLLDEEGPVWAIWVPNLEVNCMDSALLAGKRMSHLWRV